MTRRSVRWRRYHRWRVRCSGSWGRWPSARRGRRAFVQRAAKLTGARFVQTLVFGWLAQPEARLVAAGADGGGAGRGDHPAGAGRALRRAPRPTACARCWRRRCGWCWRPTRWRCRCCGASRRWPSRIARPSRCRPRWRRPGRAAGAAPPASGSAALKLGVRLDLASGQLQRPLCRGRAGDDRATTGAAAPLPPGALRLADLGFFRLDALAAQGAQGVFWLSRWQPGTALYTPDGAAARAAAAAGGGAGATLDQPVRLGVRQRVPARLLAVRVPQEVADQRRRRLRAGRARPGPRRSAPPSWRLCAWTVFVTNAPPARADAARGAGAAPAPAGRSSCCSSGGQGHLRVDDWRSANPWRILTAGYAKLLAALVQHWLALVGCWHHPDRSLRARPPRPSRPTRPTSPPRFGASPQPLPRAPGRGPLPRRRRPPQHPRKTAPVHHAVPPRPRCGLSLMRMGGAEGHPRCGTNVRRGRRAA